jgi:hyperosmotically inducible protein
MFIRAERRISSMEEIMKRLYGILTMMVVVMTAGSGQSRRPEESTARMIQEVRHEILMLPYFGVFDNIQFGIEGTTVTLTGQVLKPTLKADAEAAVRNIEGVEAVNNRIEVLPLSSNDDRLRVALYRAIYGSTALQRYAWPVIRPIRIIVRDGHLTLEGVVDSETDKNMAGLRARGVHGIFSVTNNLRVEKQAGTGPATQHSLPTD